MPFVSHSQYRLFRAKEKRGEIPKGTASRWAHETKDISKLPERVKKKNPQKEYAERELETLRKG